MSGVKTYAVTAGAAPAAVAGAAAGIAVVVLAGAALKAYQERIEREKEAARQQEIEIKGKIAEIRRSGSTSGQPRVTVNLPKNTSKSAPAADAARKVNGLKSQLPKIRKEYQTLVEQQLLDEETVGQALEQTTQALNENNLAAAEAHLQALDDARIQVIQQSRQEWNAQVDYLHERISQLDVVLPSTLRENLIARSEQLRTGQFSEGELETLHAEITELTAQAGRIEEAAHNLVNSWQTVGYAAGILGRDDGDMVIEVQTHEGVNTQMRIQFNGEEINLFGPPEESHSCASRTIEAMRLFQQQGYQLEWTHLDHQPVPEEWRYLYANVLYKTSAQPQEVVTIETEAESVSENTTSKKSPRRQQAQGY
ncbi:MAG: hypothetical protein DSM107014_01950 [Gomphosphaeria aponina SAG 52.96 = DSM 107014]|uniref:Uncharacterized protein n=1 Tax=Gomphosphaeria aponina SAG 52.96 = DSM 107014 TaxID=1521640 RepID=A0A941JNT5_9CHRO|nr:hypothetical protein [Gomphosphaeria aponina SAG 52.96 = DSM 107014]